MAPGTASMNALSASSITAIEAVSAANATRKDFLSPRPCPSNGRMLSEYPNINARTMDIIMLGAADHPKAVETIMPSTSPIAQPVKQWSVALAAVLFRESAMPKAYQKIIGRLQNFVLV